jgi:peptide/nickel transport system permease protein
MGRYILRRLAISVPVLIGITLFTYLIINLAPGDPVSAMINPELEALLGPEYVEEQRERLGLNDPLPVRYGIWLGQLARGNFGYSLSDRQPVSQKILARVWPTVKLMMAVQLLALVVAIPLGILSALRQYTFIDYIATLFAFGAVSIPNFFLALGAIYIFAVQLGWLPTSGMFTIGREGELLDSLRYLILPASVLGLSQAAPLIRYVRSSMLEVVRQDYVRVAYAKGLQSRVVIYRHALRNALIPMVTIITLQLPVLFSGTIIIEQIFSWPGMGALAITAVLARDYPLIMAITLISGTLVVLSNLLADVIYVLVDPRIKYT